ncbi:peptidoglycan DD-metalloendopeptidase family protein [soil metagenome]
MCLLVAIVDSVKGPKQAGTARRLTAAALTALLVTPAVPATAGPRERLHQVETRQETVSSRLGVADNEVQELFGRVEAIDARRAALRSRLATLDARLRILDRRMAAIQRRLGEARQELAVLNLNIQAVAEHLARQRHALAQRAVEVYKEGPASYLDSLLSTQTLSDLADTYEYYESAARTDEQIVGRIRELRALLGSRRIEVEHKKRQIEAATARLQAHRAETARVRAAKAAALAAESRALSDKRTLLAKARGRREHFASILGELRRESNHIQQVLAAAAARAAARRAAAEAAASVSASSSVAAPPSSGQLAWPASGSVTSLFGYRVHPIFGVRLLHAGIDIGAPEGAAVHAADDGVVVFVGQESGYGNVVAIDHGGGLATTYNHLSGFGVATGQSVTRGEAIASVGCTGYCTGPHLHFEVRVNGVPVDPMPYLL